MQILSVDHLTVTHLVRQGGGKRQNFNAVHDVSLRVEEGEIVGLVGESGCGKTSLAMAICALGKVSSGAISVVGEDLLGLRGKSLRRARGNVQMVFQDPHVSLDPRQRLGDGFDELRRIHPDRDIEPSNSKLMERVGLSAKLLDRLPNQISGGQAQRISITRATMLRPRLLLADEPTSGLDASVQEHILGLLRDFQRRENLSILFVSHNLAVVRQLCDRAYVMKEGRIVEHGPTQLLFDSPEHEYTRRLIEAIPGKSVALAGYPS